MNEISTSKIPYSKLFGDSKVYLLENYVVHELTGEPANIFNDLHSKGIIQELVDLNFIAPVEVQNKNSSQIVTCKQPIGKQVYPKEWPLSLIAEAGTKFLRMQLYLDSHGFGTIDCHPYNFVLFKSELLWVDMGSFKRKEKTWELIYNESEFIENYVQPIRLAKKGMPKLARIMVAPELSGDQTSELDIILSSLQTWLTKIPRLLILKRRIRSKFRAPFQNSMKSKLNKYFPMFLTKILIKMIMGLAKLRFRYLQYWLKKSTYLRFQQVWSSYATTEKMSIQEIGRFPRIAEILTPINPRQIIDLGGNAGALIEYLDQNRISELEEYIVLDYDDGAIEIGRSLWKQKIKSQSKQQKSVEINFYYFDFANPWLSNFAPPLEKRITADVVIALALTHHLILGQHMDISTLINRFQSMTKKFLRVEFMPFGLAVGDKNSKIPEWYTLDWFREHLRSKFTIISEEKLEINRILLVAELKS